MMEANERLTAYLPPAVIEYPGKWLVSVDGATPGDVFLFFNRIEIGRYNEKRQLPGVLLVNDQTVSSRHCVITQEPDGRCFIRDMSRNGTRVDGRRLTPNLATELEPGQVLSVGRMLELRLEGSPPVIGETNEPVSGTMGVAEAAIVTVLVGDIRNYTALVRMAGTEDLQNSVNRVFSHLEAEVQALGGTVKEFQGDALFAFWERQSGGSHVGQACRAALRLDAIVKRLGADPSVWRVGGHPLQMDFALATGPVTISGYGSDGAMGLSMVGEPVVLAFRIEKLADRTTGPIIACPITRQMADEEFAFEDLGSHQPKGFDEELNLYSLVSEKK